MDLPTNKVLEIRKLWDHQAERVSDSFTVLMPWAQHTLWSCTPARTPGGSQVAPAQPPWHSWESMEPVVQMPSLIALPILPTLPGLGVTIRLTNEEVWKFRPWPLSYLGQTLRRNSHSLPPRRNQADILLHVSLSEIPSLLDSCPSSVLHVSRSQVSPGSPSLTHYLYTDPCLRGCFWKTDLRQHVLKLKCLQLGV